jgi:glycosyltransferase involved in cell wall biosynthesis
MNNMVKTQAGVEQLGRQTRQSWPKISIITPSYNQGQFIERTLKSVLDQEYPNLEFIVMDGNSSDQTVKVLKKYDRLVKEGKFGKKINFIWRSEKDGGQTNAINKGLKIATGDILAYLNSDDTYEPQALRIIARYFLEHSQVQFVYGKGQLIDINDKPIGMYNDFQVDTEKLHRNCGVSQPTAFWRRKVLEKVGFFNESFQYTMDYEYWVRVSKNFKMVYLPQILASTRIHPDAKTSNQTQKLYQNAIRVQKLHYPFVHHDWIFTYSDGLVHAAKNGSWYQEIWYWSVLFIASFFFQVWWNHQLPTSPMRQQYKLWFSEIRERFGRRLKGKL